MKRLTVAQVQSTGSDGRARCPPTREASHWGDADLTSVDTSIRDPASASGCWLYKPLAPFHSRLCFAGPCRRRLVGAAEGEQLTPEHVQRRSPEVRDKPSNWQARHFRQLGASPLV